MGGVGLGVEARTRPRPRLLRPTVGTLHGQNDASRGGVTTPDGDAVLLTGGSEVASGSRSKGGTVAPPRTASASPAAHRQHPLARGFAPASRELYRSLEAERWLRGAEAAQTAPDGRHGTGAE